MICAGVLLIALSSIVMPLAAMYETSINLKYGPRKIAYIKYTKIADCQWEINDLYVEREYRKLSFGSMLVYRCYKNIKDFDPQCKKIIGTIMPTDPLGPNFEYLESFFCKIALRISPNVLQHAYCFNEPENMYLACKTVHINLE